MFVVSNCRTADGFIYYPSKLCRNSQRHPSNYVLAHLTGGRGMNSRYNLLYMHGERTVSGPIASSYSNPEVADATGGSTE
jgi:hypothetical protein